MSKPKFVYVTYIAAAPREKWEALTKPDLSEKYWSGYRVSGGKRMTDLSAFKRSTSSILPPTPETVWQALTDPALSVKM